MLAYITCFSRKKLQKRFRPPAADRLNTNAGHPQAPKHPHTHSPRPIHDIKHTPYMPHTRCPTHSPSAENAVPSPPTRPHFDTKRQPSVSFKGDLHFAVAENDAEGKSSGRLFVPLFRSSIDAVQTCARRACGAELCLRICRSSHRTTVLTTPCGWEPGRLAGAACSCQEACRALDGFCVPASEFSMTF